MRPAVLGAEQPDDEIRQTGLRAFQGQMTRTGSIYVSGEIEPGKPAEKIHLFRNDLLRFFKFGFFAVVYDGYFVPPSLIPFVVVYAPLGYALRQWGHSCKKLEIFAKTIL